MGYRSDVKILMGDKALELMKETLKNHSKEYVRELIERPSFYSEEPNNNIIGWSYVKWYPDYEDVSAVLSVLSELDRIVDNDPDKLDDYYYKLIELGEDNATSISTNDYDEEFTHDFYISCEFSM